MELSEQFLNDQKKSLLAEKDRLEKEIRKLGRYPDYGETPDDNDMELRDFENNKSIEDQLLAVLEKIGTALKAIDNGTYGQCKECQNLIESGRLKVMPYADLCVSCNKNAKK
jgi:RNA polymerase-binding transcription factor DksA